MSVDSFRVDSVNLPVCMVGIKSASRVPFMVRIVPSDFSKTTFEIPMDNLVFKISRIATFCSAVSFIYLPITVLIWVVPRSLRVESNFWHFSKSDFQLYGLSIQTHSDL
ncbi:conserved hypothetical protein [Escherichia phage AR1]|uniref:Uncharacterized protein n=1 Tax=Escherichia phage AR1 TaxID=66711 RepID=D4ZA16_BPAR1|nr:hypothetical protein AR1_221 [Escherichia phage AR1]BAI83228.1 conserved hypothetical protein [Escherichia phage AR1]